MTQTQSTSARVEDAEGVREKERADFCDYCKPRHDANRAFDLSRAVSAKSQLDSLFDDTRREETGADKSARATQ
jgi:hypothetical protein